MIVSALTLMLNRNISYFKNSVDPDQLASEKPADQDLYWFSLSLQKHANNEML